MPQPSFLQDLSGGIFERLGKINQDKESQDQQQKAQLINLVAGLADKVEPGSLPLLMGHIGELTGINKNKKFKSFWDAFSGLPSQDMSQQLGSKFKEIASGMIGPQEAKDIRLRGNIAQQGIPGMVNPAQGGPGVDKARMDLERLKSKMIFRDPYQEKLGQIQTQYGAALENQKARQEESHAAAMQRLQTTHELNTQRDFDKYNQKLNFAVEELARKYMTDEDILQYHPTQRLAAARQKARATLSQEEGLKVENLQQNVEVKKSVTAKNLNDLRTGGSPSVRLGEKRFAYSKGKDRNKLQDEFSSAQAEYDTFNPQISEMEKDLDNEAKRYGVTRQKLLEGESILSGAGPIANKIKAYRAKIEARNKAEATLKAKREQLEEFDKAEGRAGPAKPQPPPKATKGGQVGLAPTPREGVPLNRVRIPREQIESRGHKIGDIIETGGRKYTVEKLVGEWYTLKPAQ